MEPWQLSVTAMAIVTALLVIMSIWAVYGGGSKKKPVQQHKHA